MKKYTITGWITEAILGIIVSIYFATQSGCIGSYLDHIDKNGIPVMGSVCPKIDLLSNLQNNIFPELGMIILFILFGVLFGWIIGRIIHKVSK